VRGARCEVRGAWCVVRCLHGRRDGIPWTHAKPHNDWPTVGAWGNDVEWPPRLRLQCVRPSCLPALRACLSISERRLTAAWQRAVDSHPAWLLFI